MFMVYIYVADIVKATESMSYDVFIIKSSKKKEFAMSLCLGRY